MRPVARLATWDCLRGSNWLRGMPMTPLTCPRPEGRGIHDRSPMGPFQKRELNLVSRVVSPGLKPDEVVLAQATGNSRRSRFLQDRLALVVTNKRCIVVGSPGGWPKMVLSESGQEHLLIGQDRGALWVHMPAPVPEYEAYERGVTFWTRRTADLTVPLQALHQLDPSSPLIAPNTDGEPPATSSPRSHRMWIAALVVSAVITVAALVAGVIELRSPEPPAAREPSARDVHWATSIPSVGVLVAGGIIFCVGGCRFEAFGLLRTTRLLGLATLLVGCLAIALATVLYFTTGCSLDRTPCLR